MFSGGIEKQHRAVMGFKANIAIIFFIWRFHVISNNFLDLKLMSPNFNLLL